MGYTVCLLKLRERPTHAALMSQGRESPTHAVQTARSTDYETFGT